MGSCRARCSVCSACGAGNAAWPTSTWTSTTQATACCAARLMPASERLGVSDARGTGLAAGAAGRPVQPGSRRSGAGGGGAGRSPALAAEARRKASPTPASSTTASSAVACSEQLTRYPPARLAIACDPRRSPDRGTWHCSANSPAAPPAPASGCSRLRPAKRSTATAWVTGTPPWNACNCRTARPRRWPGWRPAMTEPLILAVVGHTSPARPRCCAPDSRPWIRRSLPSPQHHPPRRGRARLSVDGEALLELYDTPGLEDAIALLDYLDALERPAASRWRNAWRGCWTATKRAGVSNRKPRWSASCSPPTPGSVIDAREPVLAKVSRRTGGARRLRPAAAAGAELRRQPAASRGGVARRPRSPGPARPGAFRQRGAAAGRRAAPLRAWRCCWSAPGRCSTG